MRNAPSLAAILVGLVCAGTAHGLPAEFWQLLRSPDHNVRLETVRGFAIEQSGQSAEDTLNVILVALGDKKDDVRVLGAQVLQRMARAGALASSRDQQEELVSRVEQAVRLGIMEGSDELAAQLAIAYTLFNRDSADFERAALRRLNGTTDLSAQREFIDVLAWSGLKVPEAEVRLFELASGTPTIAARKAAIVLAALEPPNEKLVVALLRLASTNDFFCDPRLLEPLVKSPREARKHLAEIKALQVRLQSELVIDPFKRKTKIYAPEHYLDTMQNVIGAIEGSF